jgi:hypothetical protein
MPGILSQFKFLGNSGEEFGSDFHEESGGDSQVEGSDKSTERQPRNQVREEHISVLNLA